MQLDYELTTTINAHNKLHSFEKYTEILLCELIEHATQQVGAANHLRALPQLDSVLQSMISMNLFWQRLA
tara:strand:- start:370 stop:579 length:210 start_codon:yes stop_codon:yes gene_type:complete